MGTGFEGLTPTQRPSFQTPNRKMGPTNLYFSFLSFPFLSFLFPFLSFPFLSFSFPFLSFPFFFFSFPFLSTFVSKLNVNVDQVKDNNLNYFINLRNNLTLITHDDMTKTNFRQYCLQPVLHLDNIIIFYILITLGLAQGTKKSRVL